MTGNIRGKGLKRSIRVHKKAEAAFWAASLLLLHVADELIELCAFFPKSQAVFRNFLEIFTFKLVFHANVVHLSFLLVMQLSSFSRAVEPGDPPLQNLQNTKINKSEKRISSRPDTSRAGGNLLLKESRRPPSAVRYRPNRSPTRRSGSLPCAGPVPGPRAIYRTVYGCKYWDGYTF